MFRVRDPTVLLRPVKWEIPDYRFNPGGIRAMTATRHVEPAKPAIPQWFREARLGMFVHWGIYSVMGHGEQPLIRELLIPSAYRKLADRWRAERYDPADWAATATRPIYTPVAPENSIRIDCTGFPVSFTGYALRVCMVPVLTSREHQISVCRIVVAFLLAFLHDRAETAALNAFRGRIFTLHLSFSAASTVRWNLREGQVAAALGRSSGRSACARRSIPACRPSRRGILPDRLIG